MLDLCAISYFSLLQMDFNGTLFGYREIRGRLFVGFIVLGTNLSMKLKDSSVFSAAHQRVINVCVAS